MPGKKKKRHSFATKKFMERALERGYTPLTSSQVRYFNEVVHGGRKPRAAHVKRAAVMRKRRT